MRLLSTKYQIEGKANLVRDNVGYTGGKVDVVKTAKSLGFVLSNALLPDGDDGFVLVDRDSEYIPKVNYPPPKGSGLVTTR